MKKTQTWLAVLITGVGLIVALVMGVFAYLSLTATPIHPSAQDVSSVAAATPPRKWADAIARGREMVRASVIEQNLPGISVAVGADGDVIWAEGFGWADV